MSGESNPGCVVAGIFLILFGLCITLLGGGCTLLVLTMAPGASFADVLPALLISLVVLAGGLLTVWAGFKLTRGDGGG